MTNTFYNAFDSEQLRPSRAAADYRSVFRRSRDRLIHNAAFRRLQAKTQVFLSGEYDFYRTRLTHSIEVAQIASSICAYLNHASDQLGDDCFIDPDLCEAAALAHDIGHPPFGHAGETALHTCLAEFGGFEGNAQTLRLITETIFTSGESRRGLNPCRALIDAVLKYKTLYGDYDQPPERHYIYDDQQRYVDFVCGGRSWPASLPPGSRRNDFRSVECQIMDWADDTAYSLNDLVDGVNAGFVTVSRIARWAEQRSASGWLQSTDHGSVEDLSAAVAAGTVERIMNRKIGQYVTACSLMERDNFLTDLSERYRFGLTVDPAVRRQQSVYKQMARDLVFRSPQICQLEYKGRTMLTKLFATLRETYLDRSGPQLTLLSRDFESEISQPGLSTAARARIICDYLAGMTDGYATRIYKRLFDPDFGSIVDLV